MRLNQISDSIVSSIPSLQDIVSAVATFQIGRSSKIFPEEGGEVSLSPIKGQKPRVSGQKYMELVQKAIDNNDISILISGLRSMGIDMNYSTTTNFNVPKVPGKEVGGVSTRGEGGIEATELRRTGTSDHVEIEVPYTQDEIIDPDEALDDIDDSFVFHTHPKMTDNNYFPGKSQIT